MHNFYKFIFESINNLTSYLLYYSPKYNIIYSNIMKFKNQMNNNKLRYIILYYTEEPR